MRLRDEIGSLGHRHDPRSIPLGKIWSAITSEVGEIFTEGTQSTTDGSAATTSPVPMTMITTRVPVPVLTTTVDTTVVQTSFVTVRVTTPIPDPHPHTTNCQISDSCGSATTTAANKHTSLPELVTRTTSSSTTSGLGPHQSEQSVTAPSASSSPIVSHDDASRKHAIIGGLSGAIAGLVLIGALIILFLRRRRRRDEESESTESMSEKGLRPILVRKWSQLTARRSVAEPEPVVSRGTTPDLDGGILRVSMDNWPRPFAHGESFRESMGPGRLRVMNPDPSRPVTPLPRGSSETNTGSFFKQPRTALAAFLGANRSRQNSASGTPNRDLQLPTIAIDPAGSTDRVAPQAPTPSFRSYPSVTSLPVVEQRPPEDPFLTPPDERDEMSTPPTPRRPGLTPIQNAAGAAGRTLSQLGSALNPFRSKSNMAMSMKSQQSQQSRHSVSTFFSSSSAGDPFKLDRPSVYERSLAGTAREGNDDDRPEMPTWTLYEGT